MARKKRSRCAFDGCRKLQTVGIYCDDHQKEMDAAAVPYEHSRKLSEIDRLRFLEADTALLNHSQEIKILQQEQHIEDIENGKRRAVRQNRVNELKAAIEVRSKEQKIMLTEFAERYKFDLSRVSIDDRTGVIMEHTPG